MESLNKKLPAEVMKAIRGELTQLQMSELMGFGFNKAFRIESGRVTVWWDDFTKAALSRGRPLHQILRQEISPQVPDHLSGQSVLSILIADRTLQETAQWLSCSKARVQRWLAGNAKVPLHVLFRALNSQKKLLKVLEGIVPLASLHSFGFSERERETLEQKAMSTDHDRFLGRALAVLTSLDLTEVKHAQSFPLSWVSNKIGIAETELQYILNLLEDLGVIENTGVTTNGSTGTYRVKNPTRLIGGRLSVLRHAVAHSLELSQKRLSKIDMDKNLASVIYFGVDESALEAITREYFQFRSRVLKILTQGPPKGGAKETRRDVKPVPHKMMMLGVQFLEV